MKIKDLLSTLSRGELSNLSMSNEGSGEIVEAQQPKIIDYTNDGLLVIYSRFILSEKTLICEQVQHITQYHMLYQFAESSQSNEAYRYIKDMDKDPFLGDVIKILEVYDSGGYKRVLNESGNSLSLFTPQPHVLQVPVPIAGQALAVQYQARHKPLKLDGDGFLNQDITIPFTLEGALRSFIAYKTYSHMNGPENKASAQEFFNTYDTLCRDIEEKDMVNNTSTTVNEKLEERGFV